MDNRRGGIGAVRTAGLTGVLTGTALAGVVLLGSPASATEPPAPVSDAVDDRGPDPVDDPCATTSPDGTPREPDPMCQSGMPVEEGEPTHPTEHTEPDQPGDVLPRTGADDDRLLALAAVGAGAVLVGAGAVVAGRRRGVGRG